MATAEAYRVSMRNVRGLLERAGTAAAVTSSELERHRADLFEVKARAERARSLGPEVAASFSLSDEVARLIERLEQGLAPLPLPAASAALPAGRDRSAPERASA